MAVITELIDAGLNLKRQDNLSGAIEHFRQLHATYPNHARIMFELAGCWRAFQVPEQALPLYRQLLTLPKDQALSPKDAPRLYTNLSLTLLELGKTEEALLTIDEGLRHHPSYRPLRLWRVLSLSKSEDYRQALLDALELMMDSLAPSRWDIFEEEIGAAVKKLQADLATDMDTPARAAEKSSARTPVAELGDSKVADETAEKDSDVKPPGKQPRRGQREENTASAQRGKKAAPNDKAAAKAAKKSPAKQDDPPANASAFRIPIDDD